jgi:hypothetical protein
MKTTLIKTDFAIQCLLVVANMVLSVVTIIDFNQVFILLLLQLGTAVYLLVSGIAGWLMLERTGHYKNRNIFLLIAAVYMIMLITTGIYVIGHDITFAMAFAIIPQLLIYTYCYLSYRVMKEQAADSEKVKPIELTVLF